MQARHDHLLLALRLARRGAGFTSPNPMVGAVLVRDGRVIGCGWHHRAGEPHAEIEALRDAARKGHSPAGATLYVTLEPCCTQGRTPPCTDAIVSAGIRKVVVGAIDPNPCHCGKGLAVLRRAGLEVISSPLSAECARLNEAFNHWIVHRTPFVTVKAALTLDGKIATSSGESKWITGEAARAHGMRLRAQVDAILVGVNTILADDPELAFRTQRTECDARNAARERQRKADAGPNALKELRRIVLDSNARTPLTARVVSDKRRHLTTIVVGKGAPARRVNRLARRVKLLSAPCRNGRIDLRWLMSRLGAENITSLLVEGGGEVNASFLFGGFAHKIAFFYAPRILGGRDSIKAVAGKGAARLDQTITLADLHWRRLGADWLLTARC